MISHSPLVFERSRARALKNAKGLGNFRDVFMYTPNGKKGGIQLIRVSEVAAKDELLNIKNVTRDDLLAARRVPPQLLGIVPSNSGGWCADRLRRAIASAPWQTGVGFCPRRRWVFGCLLRVEDQADVLFLDRHIAGPTRGEPCCWPCPELDDCPDADQQGRARPRRASASQRAFSAHECGCLPGAACWPFSWGRFLARNGPEHPRP